MSGDHDLEVLAQWEQRLRLVRLTGHDGVEHFGVEEFEDGAVVVDSARYARDDFPVAAGAFVLRIADALDPSPGSAAQVVAQTLLALARADIGALSVLFHDDYVHIDHRPIGFPDADKAEMLEMQVAQADAPPVWLTQSVDTWSSVGGVSTGGYWMLNFGRWTPYEYGIHLAVVKDGQLVNAEIFPEGQLDAALDRFAELTASAEGEL